MAEVIKRVWKSGPRKVESYGLGGWKTERMMRRYAAVTDQTLRAAAEAVSGSHDLVAVD